MIKFKKNGFSIIELIIAGSISITAIGIGYSLLQIALKGNKIDETQMGINGRINDTLDFILDEVKASKRIIDDESKIIVQNITPDPKYKNYVLKNDTKNYNNQNPSF